MDLFTTTTKPSSPFLPAFKSFIPSLSSSSSPSSSSSSSSSSFSSSTSFSSSSSPFSFSSSSSTSSSPSSSSSSSSFFPSSDSTTTTTTNQIKLNSPIDLNKLDNFNLFNEQNKENFRIKKINILEAPEFLQRLKTFQEIETGKTAIFEAEFKSTPSASVVWTREEQILKNTDKYLIEINQSTGKTKLSITHLNRKDEGPYKCKLENQEGSASSTGYLSVIPPKQRRGRKRGSGSCKRISSPPVLKSIPEQIQVEEKEEKDYKNSGPSPLNEFISKIKHGVRSMNNAIDYNSSLKKKLSENDKEVGMINQENIFSDEESGTEKNEDKSKKPRSNSMPFLQNKKVIIHSKPREEMETETKNNQITQITASSRKPGCFSPPPNCSSSNSFIHIETSKKQKDNNSNKIINDNKKNNYIKSNYKNFIPKSKPFEENKLDLYFKSKQLDDFIFLREKQIQQKQQHEQQLQKIFEKKKKQQQQQQIEKIENFPLLSDQRPLVLNLKNNEKLINDKKISNEISTLISSSNNSNLNFTQGEIKYQATKITLLNNQINNQQQQQQQQQTNKCFISCINIVSPCDDYNSLKTKEIKKNNNNKLINSMEEKNNYQNYDKNSNNNIKNNKKIKNYQSVSNLIFNYLDNPSTYLYFSIIFGSSLVALATNCAPTTLILIVFIISIVIFAKIPNFFLNLFNNHFQKN